MFHEFLIHTTVGWFGSLKAFETILDKIIEENNLDCYHEREYSDVDNSVRAVVVVGSDVALIFLKCHLDGFW